MIVLAYLFLAPVLLWALFLMYCTLNASRKSGKFYEAPWPVRGLSYALLAVMVVADILFNFTIGTVLFLELPQFRRPTFTQRCSRHLSGLFWRGDLARWFCFGWMNPFEPDHCSGG